MAEASVKIPQRRGDLDIARAIAAFAVVLNHIPQYFLKHDVANFSPAFGNAVIEAVRFIHIPTFMLVSGILLAKGRNEVRSLGGYVSFERKKLLRIALPFVAITLLHLAVKLAAPGGYSRLVWDQARMSLLSPSGGLAGHLWFLYALMTIFLIWPALAPAARGRGVWLLEVILLAIAVLPINWPPAPGEEWGGPHPLFGLEALTWYLPVFVLGYFLGNRALDGRGGGALAIVVALGTSVATQWGYVYADWPDGLAWVTLQRGLRMAGHISTGLLVLWVSRHIYAACGAAGRLLAWVGIRSYDIYLLHVALVGHPLAFLLGKVHLGPAMTYVLFAAVQMVTYIVPLGIGVLIRQVPPLAMVMLGVPMRPKRPPA